MTKLTPADEARTNFLSDVKLSLQHQQPVSSLLLSAPSAIGFLGNLRLYAYEEQILRVSLNLENTTRIKSVCPQWRFVFPFSWTYGRIVILMQRRCRQPSLTAAIEQLVHEANDAFSLAQRNMYAIDIEGQKLFGGNSVVSTPEILRMAEVKRLEDVLWCCVVTYECTTDGQDHQDAKGHQTGSDSSGAILERA